jgi:type II secretory pathway component PulF
MPIAMKGEAVMTDYQFKSIIRMILSIAESKGDVAEVIEELKRLLEEPENDRK